MSGSRDSSSPVLGNGFQHVELLSASEDPHGGVIVSLEKPMESEVYHNALRNSLALWRKQGKKGVWIKLPLNLANLVEPTVQEGFRYHHAEPDYLMLVRWIPETPSTIPANATHRVGIGAIVMNDRRELLVVQEKSGRLKGMGIWKIPTGVVDAGEDLCKAAQREVKEETNIDTKFVEILGFRQSHNAFFEKSDLSFLCLMHPLSFDVQKQDLEIEAAKWMPFEEYSAQQVVQKPGFYKCISDICLAKITGNYVGFSPTVIPSSFTDQLSHFYSNKQDSKPES